MRKISSFSAAVRYLFRLSPIVLSLSSCTPSSHQKAAITKQRRCQADGVCQSVAMVNGLREGRSIVHYQSGHIKAILRYQQDTLQGVQRWFYPSGILQKLQTFDHGNLTGPSYSFFDNGRLQVRFYFKQGKRTGKLTEFYERPVERPYAIAEYQVVDNREHTNGYVRYDESTRIIDCWGFPIIHAEHDTIALGDSLILHLSVKFPKEKHTLVAIGNYDYQFRLQHPDSLQVTYGQNHKVIVRLIATHRGLQAVRGYISDYKLDPTALRKGVTKALERQMYFSYSYYVQ